jgi:hypothetical protein
VAPDDAKGVERIRDELMAKIQAKPEPQAAAA